MYSVGHNYVILYYYSSISIITIKYIIYIIVYCYSIKYYKINNSTKFYKILYIIILYYIILYYIILYYIIQLCQTECIYNFILLLYIYSLNTRESNPFIKIQHFVSQLLYANFAALLCLNNYSVIKVPLRTLPSAP